MCIKCGVETRGSIGGTNICPLCDCGMSEYRYTFSEQIKVKTSPPGCPCNRYIDCHECVGAGKEREKVLDKLKKLCNDEINSLIVGDQSRNTEQPETMRNAIAAGLYRSIGFVESLKIIKSEATENPCSCATCNNWDDSVDLRHTQCKLANCDLEGEDLSFIKKIGCLSHPQAREYLMKDVINEMKDRRDMILRVPDDFAQGYKDAVEEIIVLIQDAVKRE